MLAHPQSLWSVEVSDLSQHQIRSGRLRGSMWRLYRTSKLLSGTPEGCMALGSGVPALERDPDFSSGVFKQEFFNIHAAIRELVRPIIGLRALDGGSAS